MALAMARPWKHPKTGIYWLRKAVPEDLRSLVSKREEKRSLKTRDPTEAKRLHLEALTQLEAQWANLRAGPQTLSERDAHELAASVHDHWLALHKDNPSDQAFWPVDLGDKLFPPTPSIWALTGADLSLTTLDFEDLKRQELEAWCLRQADEHLAFRGLRVDEAGHLRLAKAVAVAVQRASLTLARYARGEFNHLSIEGVHPLRSPGLPPASSAPARRIGFDELVKAWAAEKRPSAKTAYEWQRVVRQFTTFLGHDDAARLTPDDLIAWKGALVESGSQAKTIRDAKLAPIRAILQWAVDNRRLASNPAERIVIDVKTKPSEARRSFTDVEAAIVLKAALAETDPVRRWVPWLCAYSGARVAEICQLRAEDIVQIDGYSCLKIDPEAGPLKTRSSERAVPLHPALIESGFLEFVATVKSGPLFASLPPNRFGSRGGNGTKILGRWVRALGLTDARLAPNHSWRHRLKTLGRRHGLAPDIVDAITGHGRKTVADTYGEFPMEALYRELVKIPAVSLNVSDKDHARTAISPPPKRAKRASKLLSASKNP